MKAMSALTRIFVGLRSQRALRSISVITVAAFWVAFASNEFWYNQWGRH